MAAAAFLKNEILLKPKMTVTAALGPDPLDKENPHRPLRKVGTGYMRKFPDSELRTIVRLRCDNFFAGTRARMARARSDMFCTLCTNRTEEGGWQHTLTKCEHEVVASLRIRRHNDVVQLVHEAVSTGKHGNGTIHTDLKTARQQGTVRLPPPPEWDGDPDVTNPHDVLHGYVSPDEDAEPPMEAVEQGANVDLQRRPPHERSARPGTHRAHDIRSATVGTRAAEARTGSAEQPHTQTEYNSP